MHAPNTSQFSLIDISDAMLAVEQLGRYPREVVIWSLLLAVKSQYGLAKMLKVPFNLV
jgi:hypothetical protein